MSSEELLGIKENDELWKILPDEIKEKFIEYFYNIRKEEMGESIYFFTASYDTRLEALIDTIDNWSPDATLKTFADTVDTNNVRITLPDDTNIAFFEIENKTLKDSGQYQFLHNLVTDSMNPWIVESKEIDKILQEVLKLEEINGKHQRHSDVVVAVNVVATRHRREIDFVKNVSDISEKFYRDTLRPQLDECQLSWEELFSSWEESNKQVLVNSGGRLTKLKIVKEAVVYIYVVSRFGPLFDLNLQTGFSFAAFDTILGDDNYFMIAYDLPDKIKENVRNCLSTEADVMEFVQEPLKVEFWNLLRGYLNSDNDSVERAIWREGDVKAKDIIHEHQGKAITGKVPQNPDVYARHGLMGSIVAIKTPDEDGKWVVNGAGFFVDTCRVLTNHLRLYLSRA